MPKHLLRLCLYVLLPILALWLFFRILGSSAGILLVAFFLSYLSLPVIQGLERLGLRRGISIALIFTIISGLVGWGIVYGIPVLLDQTQILIREFPRFVSETSASLRTLLARFNVPYSFQTDSVLQYASEHFIELLQRATAPLFVSASVIVSSTLSGLTWLMNLALFPVFFFFLMQDYEKIMAYLTSLVPPSRRQLFLNYASEFNRILSGYIRGQLLVCGCLALLYACGLSFVGIRFGFLIGLGAGILSLIPYVGFTVGLATSLVIALASSSEWSTYFGILIVFATAQITEGYFLTPRLVGNRVGLGSLSTILALIAGANLAGFLGLIMAIPICGFLKVVLQDLIAAYRRSSIYQH